MAKSSQRPKTAEPDASEHDDILAEKAAGYGPDAPVAPPEGASVKPAASSVRASANPTAGPLDRLRVDATGSAFTINQGVPADYHNSLRPRGGQPTSRDFVSWRGHHIHVKVSGQCGEPLLLITGLGGSTHMWTTFAQQFPNRRVIRFDAPGTGESSVPLSPVPIAGIADLAAAILDDLDVEATDVIGFSYGGAVAQQLAYSHPDRVRRLVLAATSCGLGAVPGSLQAMSSLMTPLRYYSPAYSDRTACTSYGGMTGRDLSVGRRMMAERHRHPPSPYGYTMQLLGTLGWSSLPFLTRIPHDTLVICGDDDPLIPVANAKLLARRIPHARLEICARSGHLFLWDEATRMAARIGRFLDSHAGAARSAKASLESGTSPGLELPGERAQSLLHSDASGA